MGSLQRMMEDDRLMELFDFDNIQDIKSQKVSKFEYRFMYNTNVVNVKFEELDDDDFDAQVDYPIIVKQMRDSLPKGPTYNIVYDVDGVETQLAKSSVRMLLTIIKNVTSIAIDFINDNKPFAVVFFAVGKFDKDETSAQKTMSYKEIARKHRPSDYAIADVTIRGSIPGTLMFKRKK